MYSRDDPEKYSFREEEPLSYGVNTDFLFNFDMEEERETVESKKAKPTQDSFTAKRSCCTFEPDLLLFKLFYFFFFGALGSVFPFMSLYLKQLGFSPREIGLFAGVRPILGFFSGPLWGSCADRWRMRNYLLVISTAGWVVFVMGLGFVTPPQKVEDKCQSIGLNLSEYMSAARNRVVTIEEALPGSYSKLLENRSWMFDKEDLQKAFIYVFVLVIFGVLLQSPTSSLADSGCLEHLGRENMEKYGCQRSWGSLGFGAL